MHVVIVIHNQFNSSIWESVIFVKTETEYLEKELYERDRRNRHLTMLILFTSYILQMTLVMIPLHLTNPTEGRYLSSYILTPYLKKEDTKYAALAVGCMFETWFMSTQWAGLVLQIYLNLSYLQTISTSMEGLRNSCGSSL